MSNSAENVPVTDFVKSDFLTLTFLKNGLGKIFLPLKQLFTFAYITKTMWEEQYY